MCSFQCDDCVFFNLKGRYPKSESKQDQLLCICIRRAILDSFWARERSTVEKNCRELRNVQKTAELIGLNEPLPERGPFPIGDHQGISIACILLMKTLQAGKNAKHIQFETTRKVRSVLSNFIHTIPGGTGMSTMGMGDRTSFTFTTSPTNSHWFKRFMAGCHRRMGDVWIPDRAVTLDEVHCGLRILEKEWESFPQGQRRLEVALTGALIVIGFCAALRGEEIPQVDVGLIRKYWEEGIHCPAVSHVPLALAGRFKQTDGTFRLYVQPLAEKSSSGIEIRKWIERSIRELHLRKVTHGPLFRRVSKTSKGGNGPWRLISTPKSEFLEKIRRIKFFYAQFIFICAVFNYNPAFQPKSANLGLTMHISLASSRDRADYHAHATISMRTSPRSNHE